MQIQYKGNQLRVGSAFATLAIGVGIIGCGRSEAPSLKISETTSTLKDSSVQLANLETVLSSRHSLDGSTFLDHLDKSGLSEAEKIVLLDEIDRISPYSRNVAQIFDAAVARNPDLERFEWVQRAREFRSTPNLQIVLSAIVDATLDKPITQDPKLLFFNPFASASSPTSQPLLQISFDIAVRNNAGEFIDVASVSSPTTTGDLALPTVEGISPFSEGDLLRVRSSFFNSTTETRFEKVQYFRMILQMNEVASVPVKADGTEYSESVMNIAYNLGANFSPAPAPTIDTPVSSFNPQGESLNAQDFHFLSWTRESALDDGVYLGGPILIDNKANLIIITAVGCPPCVSLESNVGDMVERLGSENVTVNHLYVSSDDTPIAEPKIREWRSKHPSPGRVFRAITGLDNPYAASFPLALVVDRNGTISSIEGGFFPASEGEAGTVKKLEDAMSALIRSAK